jgi:exosome complex exonuclease DIS3/RRP44
LLPRAQWHRPRPRISTNRATSALDFTVTAIKSREEKTSAAVSDSANAAGAGGTAVPTGRVVHILERHFRPYVCTLQAEKNAPDTTTGGNASAESAAATGATASSNSVFILCVPMDASIPKIRIRTRQQQQLMNQRIVVAIDDWTSDSKYPAGHYVRSLGPIDQLETGIQSLLIENSVSMPPFPQTVLGMRSRLALYRYM